jgi:hypothetical protein
MKPLIGAAVFGLLPIPQPPPAAHSLGDRREGAAAHEKDREATCSEPEVAERLATAEELARLRRELGLGFNDQSRSFGSGRRSR